LPPVVHKIIVPPAVADFWLIAYLVAKGGDACPTPAVVARARVPAEAQPTGSSPAAALEDRVMQAIIQHACGTIDDVLRLQNIDGPSPSPHEVFVRVHAASVNHADWLVTTGRPYVMRAALGLRRPGSPSAEGIWPAGSSRLVRR
jgi:hypothetical protein